MVSIKQIVVRFVGYCQNHTWIVGFIIICLYKKDGG